MPELPEVETTLRGVSPHLEATLTTSSARPAWSANDVGFPSSVVSGISAKDMPERLPRLRSEAPRVRGGQ
jgi:hypothetical protein